MLEDLYCPQCGYNLRGIESERCPECGEVVDRQTLRTSVIPWTNRRRHGRVFAFAQTVWLVTRRPSKIGREMAQRVDHRAAQRFRWIVVLLAAAPLVVWLLIWRARSDFHLDLSSFRGRYDVAEAPIPVWFDPAICLYAGIRMWAVPPLVVLLWLAAVTGVPSYFFHPNRLDVSRQNRAVALSYYACAPLAWMFVPTVMCALIVHFDPLEAYPPNTRFPMFEIGLLIPLAVQVLAYLSLGIFVSWWYGTLRILSATTHCSPARLLAVAALLPCIWVALGVLILGALPACAGFLWILGGGTLPY